MTYMPALDAEGTPVVMGTAYIDVGGYLFLPDVKPYISASVVEGVRLRWGKLESRWIAYGERRLSHAAGLLPVVLEKLLQIPDASIRRVYLRRLYRKAFNGGPAGRRAGAQIAERRAHVGQIRQRIASGDAAVLPYIWDGGIHKGLDGKRQKDEIR